MGELLVELLSLFSDELKRILDLRHTGVQISLDRGGVWMLAGVRHHDSAIGHLRVDIVATEAVCGISKQVRIPLKGNADGDGRRWHEVGSRPEEYAILGVCGNLHLHLHRIGFSDMVTVKNRYVKHVLLDQFRYSLFRRKAQYLRIDLPELLLHLLFKVQCQLVERCLFSKQIPQLGWSSGYNIARLPSRGHCLSVYRFSRGRILRKLGTQRTKKARPFLGGGPEYKRDCRALYIPALLSKI